MTQHDLAKRVGMPQPSVARIERGAVTPRTATLIRMLKATGHRLSVEPISEPVDRGATRQRRAKTVPQRTRLALGRAARDPRTNPIRILVRLRRFNVPFVLIGELAEVAHGSPIDVGRGVEVCHASTDTARERLTMALDGFEQAADVRLVSETAAGDGYDVLAGNARPTPVDTGILVRVAALEDLIRIRRARCTDADREAAAILEAIADDR